MSLKKLKEAHREAKMAAAASMAAEAMGDDTQTPNESQPFLEFFKVRFQGEHYKDVVLVQTGFIKLLMKMGFRRYDRNDGSFCIVRMQDNVLEEISIHNLRVLVLRYIENLDAQMLKEEYQLPHADLVEKYVRSMATLLSDEKLSLLLLEGEAFELVRDTRDTAYFFFQNGFVQVTKSGAQLRPYTQLPGAVWKNQILKRDFTKMSDEEVEKGMFYRFCCNVAGNRPKDNLPANATRGTAPERFVSLMSITGYNLHDFYATSLKATILLDARTSEEPDGRSGKSLWCKALQQVLTGDIENSPICVTVDGKTFDPDNRFKYDQIQHNTRLVIFDDIKRNLQIEEFYNSILDGFLVERKGSVRKERVRTKALFTLNYTMRIKGGSARDRVVEFEFADHYSNEHKPEHEFGCWFFLDWDETEWCRFDNFLMHCVDAYFNLGIVKAESINLNARKLRDQTSPEFIAMMEENPLEHEKLYPKKELLDKLVDADSQGRVGKDELKWANQRTITAWIKDWAELRPEVAGWRTSRSNGKDYIQIFYNLPVQEEFREATAKTATVKFFPGKSDKCFTDPNTDAATGEGRGQTCLSDAPNT